MLERLQKIIAHAGFASRREAETIIGDGRVSLNGRVVTELGTPNGLPTTIAASPTFRLVTWPTLAVVSPERRTLTTARSLSSVDPL